jgi:integrase
MARVFRQKFTKAMPKGAEVVTVGRGEKARKVARWTDGTGERREAPVTKAGLVAFESETYYAEFRDGAGVLRRVATGCRNREAASSFLADLVRRSERVRSGIQTEAEAEVADRLDEPILDHVADYVADLRERRGKGGRRHIAPRHVQMVEARLRLMFEECRFKRLRDASRSKLEAWRNREYARGARGRGARTLNAYMVTALAFGRWAVEAGRLLANPFAGVTSARARLDEAADCRRKRRALSAEELRRLLWAARLRPVAEFGRPRVPAGPDELERRAEAVRARLAGNPERLRELEAEGETRSLTYKALFLTGLRRGELASVAVGQYEPAAPGRPGACGWIQLRAADAKSGKGAEIPVRGDLAADLDEVLRRRLSEVQTAAREAGDSIPARLHPDEKLLEVPVALGKWFDMDIHAAGIPKRDGRGRTVDVHALRHSMASHMNAAGVAPRTVQEAMRHSTLDLTMNTYTDPRLLDLGGAVERLPELPLRPERERVRATGTEDVGAPLTALLTYANGKRGHSRPLSDNLESKDSALDVLASLGFDASSGAKSSSDAKRAKGFEPSTFSLGSRHSKRGLRGNPRAAAKVSASAYRSAYLSGAAALLRMLEDPFLRDRLLELLAKPRPSA